MIKVVLDTNVFVSGILRKDGVPGQVLEFWKRNSFIVVVSPGIVREIQNVLTYYKISRILEKYGVEQHDMELFFSTLRFSVLLVIPRRTVTVIAEDPSDNKFLACAEAGDANYIISGDRHLLGLGKFKKTRILSPRDFLSLL